MAARTVSDDRFRPSELRMIPAALASAKPDAPWTDRFVDGFYGRIAIRETGGEGLPLVLIHGEASSKEVFRPQMLDALGARHRLIAIDLPGYGASEAPAGADGLSLMSLADAVIDTIERLGIERFAVLGWSLGGFVALEAAAGAPGIAGVMLVGTPLDEAREAACETAGCGPKVSPESEALAGATDLGRPADDLEAVVALRPNESDVLRAVMAGTRADQRSTASTLGVPLAIVSGANDPLGQGTAVSPIGVPLWENRPHIFPFAGRAPFLDAPELFNATLARFLHHLGSEQNASTRLCFAG